MVEPEARRRRRTRVITAGRRGIRRGWIAAERAGGDAFHPPLGFALFYLRGIAPASVRTSEIYWSAIPWVFLQVILVIIVIFWPGSVTYRLHKPLPPDPSRMELKIDMPEDILNRNPFRSDNSEDWSHDPDSADPQPL